jgi:hypothetical protein
MKRFSNQTLCAAALSLIFAGAAQANDVVNQYLIPQVDETGLTQIFDAGSDVIPFNFDVPTGNPLGATGDTFFNYGIVFSQPPTSFLSFALSADNGSVEFDKIEVAAFDGTSPDLLGTPFLLKDFGASPVSSFSWASDFSMIGSAFVLFVEGTALSDDASYTGVAQVTLGDAPAEPVPEPETWALMLLGLGVVGTVKARAKPRA